MMLPADAGTVLDDPEPAQRWGRRTVWGKCRASLTY